MTIILENHCTSISKICSKCKIDKNLEEFGNAGRGDSRLRSYCKDCARAYRNHPDALQRASDNRDKYNANRRAKYDPELAKYSKIEKNYNITRERYDELYEFQNGLCAICHNRGSLAVDHDHSCCPDLGKSCGLCVRGLLCNNCNNGLGRFQDRVDYLQDAVKYLLEKRD